jgi:hypothetical protein
LRGPSRQRFTRGAGLLRQALLLGILVDFALIAFATLNADSPLRQPGGLGFVLKAVAPLAVYALACGWAAPSRLPRQLPALRIGVRFGLAGGLLQLVHMLLENVGNRVGERAPVTLAFMLTTFLLWGVAGFCAARATSQLKAAVVAGCSSAMLSVLIAVTFGLLLMTANFPSPAYVATWPEFQHSGWANAHAYAIANSLDAVLSHLLIGPVAGVILGLAGGAIAKLAFGRGHAIA